MSLSILNGFLIFSVIQSFLFASLFHSKKQRIKADQIMVMLLLVFAIHSFLILVNLNNPSSKFLNILPISLTLLYGPLLFLYISSISSELKNLRKSVVWHFIPFIVFSIMSSLCFEADIFLKIIAVSGVVSGVTYCVFTYHLLKKHKQLIAEQFSHVEKISLNWVSKLVTGILFIWSGVVVLVVLNRILNISVSLNWFFLCIPLFISYIGYYGLKQQIIFTNVQFENYTKNEAVPKNLKQQNNGGFKKGNEKSYKKSVLCPNDMEMIYKSLENVMQTQKLYLLPTLSLKELSEASSIAQHHITQTLNEYASVNFYDYTNAYRVATFKKKLQQGDAEKFSLLGIAFDCGFNSKSSFNRIFKNSTGQSPSEYKKSIS